MDGNFVSLSVLDIFKMHPTNLKLSIKLLWHNYMVISILKREAGRFFFFSWKKRSGSCLNAFLLITVKQDLVFWLTARVQYICVCSTRKHLIVFICIWELYHGCLHKIFFVQVRLTLFNSVCFKVAQPFLSACKRPVKTFMDVWHI